MPFIPRYFTYSSMTFSPLFSICSFYSGNWYEYLLTVAEQLVYFVLINKAAYIHRRIV
ncbi:hypothetical protein [Wolbachia endosymbiont of Frankliniella intonsa]|uniref:hypothetical protein n=1 Tax=Wolbachia endosymbiont of Frankliniella intonsa TaxID=2902422 RepID=UPI00244EFA8A|nr:hypothetical protein [Wolbachia endosymbiont of Frankliniella intonsa]WGJ61741.1 hypothetical protein M3L71_05150 [Wolbachia endosymbiont of Frankliniella intonsa]